MISSVSHLFQQTPLGLLQIFSDGNVITAIQFISTATVGEDDINKERIQFEVKKVNDFDAENGNALIQLTIEQIKSYLFKGGQQFSLPLGADGTAFQKRVWQALQQIPYGHTITYGKLAEQLNSSARAVGNACRRNPIPVIIPCHRVIASNGIGGYSGATSGYLINRKQFLLNLEQAQSSVPQEQLILC